MITELGIVAGDIWNLLDKSEESELTDIVTTLEKPRDTILMSLGWLAREGHVKLSRQGENYKIFLRK